MILSIASQATQTATPGNALALWYLPAPSHRAPFIALPRGQVLNPGSKFTTYLWVNPYYEVGIADSAGTPRTGTPENVFLDQAKENVD